MDPEGPSQAPELCPCYLLGLLACCGVYFPKQDNFFISMPFSNNFWSIYKNQKDWAKIIVYSHVARLTARLEVIDVWASPTFPRIFPTSFPRNTRGDADVQTNRRGDDCWPACCAFTPGVWRLHTVVHDTFGKNLYHLEYLVVLTTKAKLWHRQLRQHSKTINWQKNTACCHILNSK